MRQPHAAVRAARSGARRVRRPVRRRRRRPMQPSPSRRAPRRGRCSRARPTCRRRYRHPPAVQAHRRVEQHQRRHQFRAGGGESAARPRSRTNARPPPPGARPPVRAERPVRRRWRRCVHGAAHDDRPWPSRSGPHRDVGQVPVASVSPPPAVAGQPVDGQHLRRLLGAEAVHVEMGVAGHPSMLPAASAGLVGPPWCHALMSPPHIALHRRTARRPNPVCAVSCGCSAAPAQARPACWSTPRPRGSGPVPTRNRCCC